jgi:hypothetical protein
MSRTLDTIPIRVPPLPGEALNSWLDAYAHRLQVYPADILGLAGMEATGPGARRSLFARKPWLAELHPQEFSALARVTGIPTSQLAGMTLTRYIGSLLTVDAATGALDLSGWIFQTQPSRYCPACLNSNGGRWKLEWRLPWSIACPEHHCLLIDHCPKCGREPRLRWGKLVRPVPGRCLAAVPQPDRTERNPRACFGRLADATIHTLLPDSSILATQREVADLIAEIEEKHAVSSAALPGPRQALGDLHDSARAAITAIQLVPGGPQRVTEIMGELDLQPGAQLFAGRSRGRSVPADARAMAFGLTVARLLLVQGPGRPDPEIARWLMQTAKSDSGPTPGVVFKLWSGSSKALQGALLKQLDAQLGPRDRLLYRTATATPSKPIQGRGTARARMTPQLFWRGLALRMLPPGSFDPMRFRSALSAFLLAAGSRDYGYRQAHIALGHELTQPVTNPSYAANSVQKAGAIDGLLSAIGQLSLRLDECGSPIDYARRRRLFSQAELDISTWNTACDEIGRRSPHPQQQRILRFLLIETLTGTHPRYLPAPVNLATLPTVGYNSSVLRLPAPLMNQIHQQAQQLLAQADIDEPVIWEPPDEWLTDVVWPGPHPDDIDLEEMWRQIRRKMAVGDIARSLGTSSEHIRCAALRHPAPENYRRSQWNSKIPRTHALSTAELRRHYEQGLSPQAIAEIAGCSPDLILRILKSVGIPRRRPGRPRTHHPDPEWIRTEYEIKKRGFFDLANEIGMSDRALRDQAIQYGITPRPVGTVGHELGRRGSPQDYSQLLWDAFTGQGATRRVQRFLAIIGYQNLAKAARGIGVHRASLSNQLDVLERSTKQELFKRTSNGNRTTTLTQVGAALAEEAQAVLRALSMPQTTYPQDPKSGAEC